jgi:vanillate O-demethylase monooxygenase subunit
MPILEPDHPLYPKDTRYAPKDWALLARYWHPVATAEEVTADKPLGVTLLDVPLVLYRSEAGVSAYLDHCPHRGTQLSLGHVRNGNLVCPYHGLEFDGAGQCVLVPAHGKHQGRARYLDIQTVRSEERYGLVWVCMNDEPLAPLPDWSLIEAPGNQRAVMHDVWNCSAARHFENFCDLAHFPFAHADTFGLPDLAEVAPYTIEETSSGFRYDVDVHMLDGNVFDEQKPGLIRCEYHVQLPFCTRLTINFSRGIEHICDVASPISANRSRVFILKSRDHDLDEPLEDWVQFQHAVNEEDRRMVESQRPTGVPLTGGIERHLSSDRFSVAYRQRWVELGMKGPL